MGSQSRYVSTQIKARVLLTLTLCITLLLNQGLSAPQTIDIRQDEPTGKYPNCVDHLPNLAVADIHLTQANFDKFKKANSLFILGVSDKGCEQCCTSEPLLDQLQRDFSDGLFTYKKVKQIKIARVDISKKYQFITKEGISAQQVPSVFVYLDGVYYLYEGNARSRPQFLHFLNKIVHPLALLKSEEEVAQFLNLEEEYIESTKFFEKTPVFLGDWYTNRRTKTRVLAFIYDKDDFVDELKNLRLTGKYSAKRDEMRIGMITDRKIIKKYKAKYGTLWFPEGTYSSLVLKRYDGQTYHADLLGEANFPFQYWINKKSVKAVEAMDQDTFRIFEMIRQPIMVAFVDLKSQNKKVFRESQDLVDNILPKVAPGFFHGVIITYADNTDYFKHRKLLGITHNKVPAIAINNNEQKVVPFPENEEMTEDNLNKWLSKFVKGKLQAKEAGFGEIIDAEIKYMMPDCKQLKRDSFVESAYEDESDVLVYLYTSSVEENIQRIIAQKFNELAQKFTQMNINTVKFYAYDVNVEGQPPRIESQEAPMIYLFPAFHKNPPYPRYLSGAKVSEMAEFVKKYADKKFTMTVDLAQQEQFQEMRMKQMYEEQDRVNSMKMIEDELRKRGEL